MSIFTTTLRFKIMLAAALLASVASFGSYAHAGDDDEDDGWTTKTFDMDRT